MYDQQRFSSRFLTFKCMINNIFRQDVSLTMYHTVWSTVVSSRCNTHCMWLTGFCSKMPHLQRFDYLITYRQLERDISIIMDGFERKWMRKMEALSLKLVSLQQYWFHLWHCKMLLDKQKMALKDVMLWQLQNEP